MKIIFDELIKLKEMQQANNAEELKSVVDQDISYLDNMTFLPYDNTRQTLNKRVIDLTQLPIEISGNGELSYIKKPCFIYPVNGDEVTLLMLTLQTDEFEIIGYLKDTHKSTIWQIALDKDFKNLLWEWNSLMFKTSIEVPDIVKENMQFGQTYFLKAKYIGRRYESEWSDIVGITIKSVIVNKPQIIVPANESFIERSSFNLESSLFSTSPINKSTHKLTQWEFSDNKLFDPMIWKIETPTFLTKISVPAINILYGKEYYVRVRYIDEFGSMSSYSEILKVYSQYQLLKPTILTPTNETTISRRLIDVTGSEFTTFPASDKEMTSYDIELSTDLNFTTLNFSKNVFGKVCEFNVPYEDLMFDTVYHIRIRYRGINDVSPWSDTVSIRTKEINIKAPIIISPVEDAFISNLVCDIHCSTFETDPEKDTSHLKTMYQISKTVLFDEKIFELETDTQLTFLSISQPQLFVGLNELFIKVKYFGKRGSSDWSDIRHIKLHDTVLPEKPVIYKLEESWNEFGSDPNKKIAYLKSKFILNDPNDIIKHSRWIFSKTANFLVSTEKILNTDPTTFPVNLNNPYFTTDTTYFVKVAFVTALVSSPEFSEVLEFKTGGSAVPEIFSYEIVNPTKDEHKLKVLSSSIVGTNGYDEKNIYSMLEVSNNINFNPLLDNTLAYSQPAEFLTSHRSYLKDDLFIRIKHNGYYFGMTPYSEIMTLHLGSIEKPKILTGSINYVEITDTDIHAELVLICSDFKIPEGRVDEHTYTQWFITSDRERIHPLVNEMSLELIQNRYTFSLRDVKEVFCSVRYYSEYFGESVESDVFQLDFKIFIYRPSFITPTDDQIVLRDEVILEANRFNCVPNTITHTSTHWTISTDMEGEDVVWESLTTEDKLKIPVPGIELSYGTKYFAHVVFNHDNISSVPGRVAFETHQVGDLKVNITPDEANVAGAQWRVEGTETWLNSDDIIPTMLTGFYVLEIKTLPHYFEYGNVEIEIVSGLNEVEIFLVKIEGALRVNILPEEAVQEGIAWKISGTEEWRNSGDNIIDIPPGTYYQIEISYTENWKPIALTEVIIENSLVIVDIQLESSFAQGAIQINVLPEEANLDGGMWRIVGSEFWEYSGVAILDIDPGTYQIELRPNENYVDVPPFDVVVETSLVVVDMTLVPMGFLQVTILPEDAVLHDACWRVVGRSIWNVSGFTESKLIAGNYQIEFETIERYLPPVIMDVTVIGGSVTEITYTYVLEGASITVNLLPPEVNLVEGAWRIVGSTEWKLTGTTVTSLPTGTYAIEVRDATNFVTPNQVTVDVITGEIRVIDIEYVIIGVPVPIVAELCADHPSVLSSRKRIPPLNVTVDIIDGEGTIEPLSKTVPYRTATSFDVVGGFVISSNDENIIKGGTAT